MEDSIVSWLILTFFSIYGVIQFGVAVIKEEEDRKRQNKQEWESYLKSLK